jgi:hypothetical protein
VCPLELGVLSLERTHPILGLPHHPLAVTGIDLCLTYPVPQGLGAHAKRACHQRDRLLLGAWVRIPFLVGFENVSRIHMMASDPDEWVVLC